MKRKILSVLMMVLVGVNVQAQEVKQNHVLDPLHEPDLLKYYIAKDSTSYIKFSIVGQFWGRYNSNNPGSTVFNDPVDESFDMGIRRARFSARSLIANRIFFYTQFGLNNLSSIGARKQGMFLHDLTVDFKLYKKYLDVGLGLSGWNGTSRFSSSSIGTILPMDLPLIQETTNDVTDQFGRKFNIYAKGKINNFSYRVALSQPLSIQTAAGTMDQLQVGEYNRAYFSTKHQKLNTAGYVSYSFLDHEGNDLPYAMGTYLGEKQVLNIGAGFQHQKDALWYHNADFDTISTPLTQVGVDVFFDSYLNKEKRNAITAYASYIYYNFGPNYIRNIGPMNPANGVASGLGSFNGAGNASPLMGTGHVVYLNAGYKFKNNLLRNYGTLQAYATASFANYEMVQGTSIHYSAGLNWLVIKQRVKVTLDYQSRPVYYYETPINGKVGGNLVESVAARRGQVVMQVQISI